VVAVSGLSGNSIGFIRQTPSGELCAHLSGLILAESGIYLDLQKKKKKGIGGNSIRVTASADI
jgi:hypothetical protein